MSKLDILKLVVVHDKDHGDFERLRRNAEIPTPFEVWSFTDTGESIVPSQYGDTKPRKARECAAKSDVLLIQTGLDDDHCTLADVALSGIHLSSAIHRLGIFDDEYDVIWTTGEQS